MRLLRQLQAFLQRDFQFEVSYGVHFVFSWFGPLVTVVMLYYLSKLVPAGGVLEDQGGDYFAFALVGTVLMDLQWRVAGVPGMWIQREMLLGSLETLATRPLGAVTLVLGPMAYGQLSGLLRGALVLVVGACMGIAFSPRPLDLLMILVASSLAWAALAFLVAASVLAFQRSTPATWLIQGVTSVFGGIFYPLSVLPEWMQGLAWAIPAAPAAIGARRALIGGGGVEEPVRALLIFALLGLPLGVAAMQMALRRARRRGTLARY